MREVDVLVSAIHVAGGSVNGRTTLQKWCYFISIKNGCTIRLFTSLLWTL